LFGRLLKTVFSWPLAYARGSVTAAESALAFQTATVNEWQEAFVGSLLGWPKPTQGQRHVASL
jgi:hypothetical protein